MMQMLRLSWSVVLAGAVMTAACGDSNSSLNPTAPSAVSSSSLNADAGDEGAESSATAKGGNGKGKGNGNGNNGGNDGGNDARGGPPSTPGIGGGPGNTSPGAPGNTSPGAPGQLKVEIEGLVMSVGTDTLTVNDQTVLVTSETVIRHGDQHYTLSQLNVGDRVHVRATRVQAAEAGVGETVEPAVESLQATEIKLQNPVGVDDGEESSVPTNRRRPW
jgi:hypothetical protein